MGLPLVISTVSVVVGTRAVPPQFQFDAVLQLPPLAGLTEKHAAPNAAGAKTDSIAKAHHRKNLIFVFI
ncbi:MAG TPA: hypothetical protein VF450_24130 [Noviherbaspirillum sp.]